MHEIHINKNGVIFVGKKKAATHEVNIKITGCIIINISDVQVVSM